VGQDAKDKLNRKSNLELHDHFCGAEAIVDLARRNPYVQYIDWLHVNFAWGVVGTYE
jgi:hypothetical protein